MDSNGASSMGLAVLLSGCELQPVATRPWLKQAQYLRLLDAQALIDRAAEEAAGIVASAQDAFRTEQEKGFEQGRQEGLAAASRELAGIGLHAARVLQRIESAVVGAVSRALDDLLAELPARQAYEAALHRSLRLMRNESFLTVRVPPVNEEAAREALASVLSQAGLPGAIVVEADASLAPLACVLESDAGKVLAGLDVQLQAIKDEVAAQMAALAAQENR